MTATIALECLAFKTRAIPVRKLRSGFVGTPTKLQNCFFRRIGGTHILIFEDEYTELVIPTRLLRRYGFAGQPRGSRSSVGVKRPAGTAGPRARSRY